MDTSARFRKLALALPGAEEGSHMGAADFRVHGRIFATLAHVARGQATLKLTLEQQAEWIAEAPDLFEPAPSGWGRMGMTLMRLHAPATVMEGALLTAWKNVDTKQTLARAKKAAKPKKQPAKRARPSAKA
jgi:hypothetical protein